MRLSHALEPARNGCATAREAKLNITLQSSAWASRRMRAVELPVTVTDDVETATANLLPRRAPTSRQLWLPAE